MKKEKEYEFWIDEIARKIVEKYPKEKTIHLNGGLSIRGPQHIGRFRTEILIQASVKKIIEEKYKRKVIQYLTLYDMDGQKIKGIKNGFPNDKEKQEKYVGVSLFNIPDPFGCCKNWQEHFWKDFGGHFKDFGLDIKIVKTSEFYKMPETKKIVKWMLENREKVVKLVNKFRSRNPWPEDYIPINPICEKCLSINDTEATGFDLDKYTVDYVCNKCGHKGTTSLENAKLNWRLEWIAIWKVLDIEFEPYGKDHAAAGGSRETCGIFSKELLNREPPYGIWCEWVSLKMKGKNLGQMTASGFVGITPKQWLEIADPEILKYLYIGTRPHTAMTIDLDKIPNYYDDYYKAEKVYFGKEKLSTEREEHNIKRAFELSQVASIKKPKIQLNYEFLSQITQIIKGENKTERAIKLLKKLKILDHDPDKYEKERIEKFLNYTNNWIKEYGSDNFRIEFLETVLGNIISQLSKEQKEALKKFAEYIKEERTDEELVKEMKKITQEINLKPEKFFKAAYLVLFGKPHGPRLVPLIQSLDRDFVVKRFLLES